jgi:hypothetical protein
LILSLLSPGLSISAETDKDWELTILHTNSLNGALDNCG